MRGIDAGSVPASPHVVGTGAAWEAALVGLLEVTVGTGDPGR